MAYKLYKSADSFSLFLRKHLKKRFIFPKSTHVMSVSLRDLSFGIEIEAVVTPWKIRPNWAAQEYHERLQKALENRGLPAAVNTSGTNRTRLEPYDKWYITNDGSLEVVDPESKSLCAHAALRIPLWI